MQNACLFWKSMKLMREQNNSSTHVQNSAQQHASNSTNALFDASAFQREQGQRTHWHTFPLMVVLTCSWFCFQGFAHKELWHPCLPAGLGTFWRPMPSSEKTALRQTGNTLEEQWESLGDCSLQQLGWAAASLEWLEVSYCPQWSRVTKTWSCST